MANNYSQPYYGLPFQFLPHQMQQSAPNAPSEAQGASPAPNAFHIPGLQQAPLPSTNHTSYNHNAQQPPFPPGKSKKSTYSYDED